MKKIMILMYVATFLFILSSLVVVALNENGNGLCIQSVSENLSITLNSPINEDNLSNSTNIFSITLTNASSYVNCTIFGNWTSWGAKQTINGTNLTNGTHILSLSDTSSLIPDSIYLWAVSCENYDNSSDVKMSGNETFTFVSDAQAPSPEILSALLIKKSVKSSYLQNETIQFLINVTNNGTMNLSEVMLNDTFNAGEINFSSSECTLDQSNISSGWLTINLTDCFGGVLEANQSSQISINFTYVAGTLPLNTTNTITADIIGSNGSTIIKNANVTVQINQSIFPDTINPNVTLSSPIDNYETSSQNITFIATTNDNVALSSCRLYVDNLLAQTNSSPALGGSTSFYVTNISEGNHFWNVSCNDTSGNFNTTDSRLFKINLSFIDNTPPVTNISLSGTAGENGWYTSEVIIDFSVVESDLNRTEYKINGGGWTTFNSPFNLTFEGNNSVQYRSVDNSGNIESTKTDYVPIDTIAPTISLALNSSPENPEVLVDNFSIHTTVVGGVNGTFSITDPSGVTTNYTFNKSGNLYFYNFSAFSTLGSFEISASIRDLAGNVLTQSYDLNTRKSELIYDINGTANTTGFLDKKNDLDVTFTFEFTNNLTNGSLNVTETGYSEAFSYPTGTKYSFKRFKFEPSAGLNSSFSWVTINMSYSDSEILGLSDTMSIYWLNESDGSWVLVNSSLDFVNRTDYGVSANYISAKISHFSEYALAAFRRSCSDNSAINSACYWNGNLYTSGYICSGVHSNSACDSGSGGSGGGSNSGSGGNSGGSGDSSSNTNSRRRNNNFNNDNSYKSNNPKQTGYKVNESDPFFSEDDTPSLTKYDEKDYSAWNQKETKIKKVEETVDEGKIWLWIFVFVSVFVAVGVYITHDHIVLNK